MHSFVGNFPDRIYHNELEMKDTKYMYYYNLVRGNRL